MHYKNKKKAVGVVELERLLFPSWSGCNPAACSGPVPTHSRSACRYTLQASTFQMAILLQYNTEDSYTVQQLTDSTQIKTVRTTLNTSALL